MPELPEVEITRRSFGDRIHGAFVIGARVGKPLRWPLGVEPGMLLGRCAGAALRRGKYLWLPLELDEAGAGGLLMHLGMSGSLAFADTLPAPGPHDHFDLVTSRGTLRLTDPRRFGAVVWSESLVSGMAAKLLAGLGIEPFDVDFTGRTLHEAFQRRSVAVKQALLTGDIVVGAGNIYACEALFEAGIDPRAPADTLGPRRCARLAGALREVLTRALALNGSTLRDFRDAHGQGGGFQAQARVYAREGLPCRVCGTTVHRIVQANRSTFFCPSCQRR